MPPLRGRDALSTHPETVKEGARTRSETEGKIKGCVLGFGEVRDIVLENRAPAARRERYAFRKCPSRRGKSERSPRDPRICRNFYRAPPMGAFMNDPPDETSPAAPTPAQPQRVPRRAPGTSDRRPRGRKLARLHPYVSIELARRIAKHCAASGITESAFIEAAAGQALDRSDDRNLLRRQLERVHGKLEQLKRDQEIALETFSLWMKVWYSHTPEIPADAAKHARAAGEKRYRVFVAAVARELATSHRFGDDVRQLAADRPAQAPTPARNDVPAAAPSPPRPGGQQP